MIETLDLQLLVERIGIQLEEFDTRIKAIEKRLTLIEDCEINDLKVHKRMTRDHIVRINGMLQKIIRHLNIPIDLSIRYVPFY